MATFWAYAATSDTGIRVKLDREALLRSSLPPVSQDGPAAMPLGSAEGDRAPRLKGYQLDKRLGIGGMGVVWRGVQLTTHRKVAVKLLAGSAFGHQRAVWRFQQEIMLCASLDHPNIAQIYDADDREGVRYFAMQLIDGPHLDAYVAQRGLTWRDRLPLMLKVCDAVAYAHHRGVIHRDLKPSNILVSSDGQPHVVDFGLAKAVANDDAPAGSLHSIEGGAIGTMAYMSPEQARGDRKQIGTASDVYSLGVVLFQLLTGQFPHDTSGTQFDHQERVIKTEPRRLREVNRKLPRDLDVLVSKALAKQPQDRYATAGELAGDLRRFVAGQPLQAQAPTAWYRASKFVRRHWRGVALTTTIVTVIVAMAVSSYITIGQERDAARRSEAQARLSAEQANRALYHNNITMAQRELEAGRVREVQRLLEECPEDLRHFEWHRLHLLSDESVATWTSPKRLAASRWRGSDGVVVSVDQAGELRTWSPHSGQETSVATLQGAVSGVQYRFTPDGSLGLIADETRLSVFRTSDGQVMLSTQIDHPLRLPALMPDGRGVIGGTGSELTRYDLVTGQRHWRRAITERLTGLQISATGGVALADAAGVHVLDPATGEDRWMVVLEDQIKHMAWSPDGRRLAATTPDRCHIWHADGPTAANPIEIKSERIETCSLAQTGSRLALGHADGSITIWDLTSATPIQMRRGHRGFMMGEWIEFADEAQSLISHDGGTETKWWDLAHAADSAVALPPDAMGTMGAILAPTTDGQVLVGHGHHVYRWNPLTNEQAAVLDHPESITSMAIHPEGRLLALGDAAGHVGLWDLTISRQIHSSKPHDRQVQHLAWSRSGRWLASGQLNSQSQLKVAGLDTPAHAENVPAKLLAVFGPDDQWLATYDERGEQIVLRQIGTWDVVRTLPASRDLNVHAAVSPDGRWLAASGTAGVGIWDLTSNQRVSFFQHNARSGPSRVAFSNDGRRLLTARDSIKVWDVPSMSELMELTPPAGRMLRTPTFGKDDRTIVAGTSEGYIAWTSRSPGRP